MKIELTKYFQEKEIEKVKKIITEFHSKLLLDPKVSHSNAVLISIYMVSNESKLAMVDKSKVETLFINLGKTKKNFSKTIYDLSGKRKRKGAQNLIDVEKEKMGLNFVGLQKIKELLKWIVKKLKRDLKRLNKD